MKKKFILIILLSFAVCLTGALLLPMQNNVNKAIGVGLATLLGTAIAGTMAAGSSIDSTQLGNAASKDIAEYQNEWNLAQWQRENEYNSPVNQMARMREAGLNPNLIYGQISSGNANSSPSAASYQKDYSGYSKGFKDLMTIAPELLTLKKMALENEGIKQDNLNKQFQNEYLNNVNFQILQQNLKEQMTKFPYLTANLNADIEAKINKNKMSRLSYDEALQTQPLRLEILGNQAIQSGYESDIKGVEARYADTIAQQRIAAAKRADALAAQQYMANIKKMRAMDLEYDQNFANFAEWKGDQGNRLARSRYKTLQERIRAKQMEQEKDFFFLRSLKEVEDFRRRNGIPGKVAFKTAVKYFK